MSIPWNRGWEFRPRQNTFLELSGGAPDPVPVVLPHDAMIGSERSPEALHANAYFPGGAWRYTKSFDVPDEWADRRVRVQFEGAYRDAMVYVNDDFAASQSNGYCEFVVDLDPHLRVGEANTITVDCRAGDDTRWYSGAGLFRPVHLWVQPLVHIEIDSLVVTTPQIDDDLAVVEVAADARNDSHRTVTTTLGVELTAPTGDVVASTSVPVTVRPRSTVTARRRVPIDSPVLWDPDDPQLHRCRATLTSGDATDVAETTFGIRSIKVDPRHGLRINGRTVKLRGACVHHDNGPIGAAAIGRAEERRVELLQAAGFNALRSAHNPMSRAMLDACDRLGVMVMDEAFDMWTEPKSDQDLAIRFVDRWRDDIAAMVRKDRNHPSVIMYCTGNEIPEVGAPLGAAWARELAEEVRALDPTRPVTTAVQPFLAIRDMSTKIRAFAAEQAAEAEAAKDGGDDTAGVNTMMTQWAILKDRFMASDAVEECLAEVSGSVDIVGYNYLDVRYDLDGDAHPDRVIVGSETYPTAIAAAWPKVLAEDHVVGDFTWTGWDYLGEVGIGRTVLAEPGADDAAGSPGVAAPFPWIAANTGDLDITGIRRPQSYLREIVFGLRAEPFIAVQRPRGAGLEIAYAGPWSWSDTTDSWTWPGAEGVELAVEVYAAAGEVELLLDGESLGRQPAGIEHGFRAEFTVAYRPGELTAVALDGGAEVARSQLTTAGEVGLRIAADRPETVFDDAALVHVAVSLVDAGGVLHPGEDRSLRVECEGPLEVVAFANADPEFLEPFGSASCPSHEGRALAVLRPTGTGTATVTVHADGLESATVEIAVAEDGEPS